MQMPEEINRLVTDRLSDLLLTPDRLSNENLYKEGATDDRIKFVGNIMIDTLEANREKASGLEIGEIIGGNLLDGSGQPVTGNRSPVTGYALMTLHRPSNVDTREVFEPIINFLCDEVANDMPLIWPIHPRSKKQLERFGLMEKVTAQKNAEARYNTMKEELAQLEATKEQIQFLGIPMSKTGYRALNGSIIFCLLGGLVFFIYKFRHSNYVTQQARSAIAEMEHEFEQHRRWALEREQKLSRELLDERNKKRQTT
jgi:hypothetical protein